MAVRPAVRVEIWELENPEIWESENPQILDFAPLGIEVKNKVFELLGS